MNISHAFAKRMGASAEIIYIRTLDFQKIAYSDIFVRLHDLLDPREWQQLLLECVYLIGRLVNLLPDFQKFEFQLVVVRNLIRVEMHVAHLHRQLGSLRYMGSNLSTE